MLKLMKTKTFWVGVLMIGAGAVSYFFDGDVNGALTKVVAGLALITGRDALRKLE